MSPERPLLNDMVAPPGRPPAQKSTEPEDRGTAAPLPATSEAGIAAHRSAARVLAEGLKAKAVAEARANEARAKVEARLAQEAGSAQIAEAKAKAEKQAKADRREGRTRARARLAQKTKAAVTYVRAEAGAIYSTGVYGTVVGVAATSQAQAAVIEFGWAWPKAVGGAVFLEGAALAFALTAHWRRLKGERALVLRALVWTLAGFAAWINYQAHQDNTLEAQILAATSLVGITLWEARASARMRDTLRQLGRMGRPAVRLGPLFWARFPSQAFWAWSAAVAFPSIGSRTTALRAGRLMRAMRERAALDADLRTVAHRAALKAANKGEPDVALAHLARVAHHGLAALASRPAIEARPAPVAQRRAEAAVPRPQARPVNGQRPTSTVEGQPRGGLHEDHKLGRWDGRPGGAAQWEARLAELAGYFPPGEPIPARRKVIARLKDLRARGAPLGFAWTSNDIVAHAVADLRTLRSGRGTGRDKFG